MNPVVLDAAPHPGGVTIRVLGSAATAFDGGFTLSVAAGGNAAEHRGRARLAPGRDAVLSTVSVATGVDGRWRAALRVVPDAGAPYELAADGG